MCAITGIPISTIEEIISQTSFPPSSFTAPAPDCLINFPEIIKIVFNENAIEVAENFLKSRVYLGFVALRCHFSNNLPGNDFNLFHTDGRNKVTQDKNKLLKYLFFIISSVLRIQKLLRLNIKEKLRL